MTRRTPSPRSPTGGGFRPGPRGLSRERAGFEARDVHYTHYGRVCPIETPEGPNIGLVTSLATYARSTSTGSSSPRGESGKRPGDRRNRLPVRRRGGQCLRGHGQHPVDADGRITEEQCFTMYQGNIVTVPGMKCPTRRVAQADRLRLHGAHSLPGARRRQPALMGSNMQRQAVPLIAPGPRGGHGSEHRIAKDSGSCVVAVKDGVVEYVIPPGSRSARALNPTSIPSSSSAGRTRAR